MQISLGRLATAAMLIITASSGPAVLANPSSADVSPALTQSDADAWLDELAVSRAQVDEALAKLLA